MLLFQYILNAVVKDFGTSPIGASENEAAKKTGEETKGCLP